MIFIILLICPTEELKLTSMIYKESNIIKKCITSLVNSFGFKYISITVMLGKISRTYFFLINKVRSVKAPSSLIHECFPQFHVESVL